MTFSRFFLVNVIILCLHVNSMFAIVNIVKTSYTSVP